MLTDKLSTSSLTLPAPAPAPAVPGARGAVDRYIWDAFHHHSRTFSLAARFLPRTVQLPIATLYLFCRTVDNIADHDVLEVGPARALSEVYAVKHRLNETLAGQPPNGLLWRRLSEVHQRFALDPVPLYQLIDGAVWDLEGRVVETREDLIAYAHLVGGSIGAMLLPFLQEGEEAAGALDGPARTLGVAMQITNILRDVGEDLHALGRVYLPAELLAAHGLAYDDLRSGTVPAGYPALMETLMDIAESHFVAGFEGVAALPRRVRPGIRAAARMYREILNEVRARGYDNLTQRAYVRLPRKLHLAVRDDYDRRRRSLTLADAC